VTSKETTSAHENVVCREYKSVAKWETGSELVIS
jgi:hypothetical protein